VHLALPYTLKKDEASCGIVFLAVCDSNIGHLPWTESSLRFEKRLFGLSSTRIASPEAGVDWSSLVAGGPPSQQIVLVTLLSLPPLQRFRHLFLLCLYVNFFRVGTNSPSFLPTISSVMYTS
jgi:hypothetical protein